jgi:peroxiredoxin
MIRELKIISVSAAILLPFHLSAQLEAGTLAPQFYLEGIYNNEEGKVPTLEALKGEIIVLDFWAIWCSPCVAAIPDNNKLSKTYSERNVHFIAITDDPKDKLENFLKKVQIDFCVGRDDDKKDFNTYKVTGRPQMYIINRDGIIVYHGSRVTEEMLEEVIATNSIALPKRIENQKVITNGGFSPGEDPLYNGVNQMLGKKSSDHPKLIDHFIIRPSLVTSLTGSGFRRAPDGYVGVTIYGGKLSDIFLFLHNFSSLNWIRIALVILQAMTLFTGRNRKIFQRPAVKLSKSYWKDSKSV